MPRDQSLRLPAFPGDGDGQEPAPTGGPAEAKPRAVPASECLGLPSDQRSSQATGLALPGHVPARALEAGQVAGARPLDHRPGGPGRPALEPPSSRSTKLPERPSSDPATRS